MKANNRLLTESAINMTFVVDYSICVDINCNLELPLKSLKTLNLKDNTFPN